MDSTSLSKIKTLQFNDQMATLNRDFLKSLRVWYEQCPHYDFSDTVKSYLKHVGSLEQLYGLPTGADENQPIEPEQKKDISINANHPERKIAKAKRRLNGDPSKLNDSIAISTPAGAPPRFSIGNVSAIGAPDNTPKASMPEPPSAQGGRKRVIRGGGPTGGSESVHFRGNEGSGHKLTIPPVTIQLPQASAGFWAKHKDKDHTGTMPVFDLIKPAIDILPPGMENRSLERKEDNKNDETSDVSDPDTTKPASIFSQPSNGGDKPTPLTFGLPKQAETTKPTFTGFSFGGFNGNSSTEEKKETEKPKIIFGDLNKVDSNQPVPPFSGFGTKDGDAAKPSLSFSGFGKKDETSSDAKPGSFMGFGKKDDGTSDTKSPITFPSFAKKEDSDTKPPGLTFPSFSTGGAKPIFGASNGTLTFPTSAPANNDANKDDDEGEYVPPKAEVVENSEPGATYSTKCSVFKMVDKKFEKLGVGMLHLKETEGKKSVLIRAATAIGTVWLNALISSAMKVVKADDKGDKLRMTAPLSSTEMGIFLIRFANIASADTVQKHIEEHGK